MAPFRYRERDFQSFLLNHIFGSGIVVELFSVDTTPAASFRELTQFLSSLNGVMAERCVYGIGVGL